MGKTYLEEVDHVVQREQLRAEADLVLPQHHNLGAVPDAEDLGVRVSTSAPHTTFQLPPSPFPLFQSPCGTPSQTHQGHNHEVVVPPPLPNQEHPHNRPCGNNNKGKRRQRYGRDHERVLALSVRLGHVGGRPTRFAKGMGINV